MAETPRKVPDTKPLYLDRKTRFGVFTRDDFSCRRCGRRTPEILLVIDYVTPISAGGTEDVSNLVTVCEDCTERKGSGNTGYRLSLDEATYAQEEMERFAAHFVLTEIVQESLRQESKVLEPVFNAWKSYRIDEKEVPVDTNARSSILHFIKQLGISAVLDAVETAMKRPGVIGPLGRWKYFCGICHSTIKAKV